MRLAHHAALARIPHGGHGRHVERQREDRVADRQRTRVAPASRWQRGKLDDEFLSGTQRRRQVRSRGEGEGPGNPRRFHGLGVRIGIASDQLNRCGVLAEDERSARLDVPRRSGNRSAGMSDETVAQQVPADASDVNLPGRPAPVESHLAAEPARGGGRESELQHLLLTGRQAERNRRRVDQAERAAGQAHALHGARYAPHIGHHQGRLGRGVGRLAPEVDDASGRNRNRGTAGQRVAHREVRHPADKVHARELRHGARGIALALCCDLQLAVRRTRTGRFVMDEDRVAELVPQRDRQRVVRFHGELVRAHDLYAVEHDRAASLGVELQVQALGRPLADSYRIEHDSLPGRLGHADVFHGDRQLGGGREGCSGREEQECDRFRKRVHVPTLVVNSPRAHVASTP